MGVELTTEMVQGAQDTEKKYGIPASVTLGQIMLESGGSNPGGLSKLAYQHNNLFGIKSSESNEYQSGTVTMSNRFGTDTGTYATFSSKTDSILEHGRILNLDRYKNNITTGDYKDWAEALQKGGYAESSTYSSQLQKVIEDNNLTQYDGGVVTQVQGESDTLKWYGDFAVIVFVVLLLIAGVLLFVSAFTSESPVSEVKKAVKKVKK